MKENLQEIMPDNSFEASGSVITADYKMQHDIARAEWEGMGVNKPEGRLHEVELSYSEWLQIHSRKNEY